MAQIWFANWLTWTPESTVSPVDALKNWRTKKPELFVKRVYKQAELDTYLFANRRGNRIKILVYDGQGIWLAARRLRQGKFHWPRANTPNANLMVSSSKPEPPPTLSQRAVSVMSLIQSAKLNGHDPHLYLKDVMDKLPT